MPACFGSFAASFMMVTESLDILKKDFIEDEKTSKFNVFDILKPRKDR